jgi:F-type H+-transporting ATPase subunit b
MPQLDFSNPLTIAQVVWMAIIFGALYYVLARYTLPQVAEVVDGRANRIAGDLDSARAAKAQSDAAIAEVNEAGRRASAEAQAAINNAIAQVKAEAQEQSRAADERLNQQLEEAEKRIGEARRAAMGALREVARDTAGALVTRLTGQAPDPSAVQGAVEGAMAAARS